jgi:hexosaminidase
MKWRLILSFTAALFIVSFQSSCNRRISEDMNQRANETVIPAPLRVQPCKGNFTFTHETRIVSSGNKEIQQIGRFLAEAIREATDFDIPIETTPSSESLSDIISLALDQSKTTLGDEGYELLITSDSITLTAMAPAGLFYGLQTIRQLLPHDAENAASLPCVEIVDLPRFKWRGMLLDCCRHFMTKEFVKRQIDLLAYHKMNTLHWHLTEDQGWRIEIKGYPKLTETGAWRLGEDGTPYGGFYTQKEIREVVEYARERYVQVIPEIELPGHAVASLAAYPEHSCTGGPFEVETNWGVHKDVYCAGKERTFQFLEEVLAEIVELFPAPYIHIGGDECPKDRWRACPDCQARIVDEGLKNEHELQSYFIGRIEGFLSTRGRRLIGWDEILEGGLAPGATVQSWRGMDGALAAARAGHDAIVSPTSHAYFDYDIGAIDLRQVYSFEPIPPGLDIEESRHILGGECNMWTEYAPQETIDSKVFPRILAMAERLWSPKARNDYREFHKRVRRHYGRLDRLGVDYGPESKPISIIPSYRREEDLFRATLEAGEEDLQIFYTTDGTKPSTKSNRYGGELSFSASTVVMAQAFRDGAPYGIDASQSFIKHAGVGKQVTLINPFSHKYTGGGADGLCNGIKGSTSFRDGRWQGFEGEDLVAIVDLGKLTPITSIGVGLLQNVGSWIFYPTRIEFSVSRNGEEFQPVATIENEVPVTRQGALTREIAKQFADLETRYIRIQAKSVGSCPPWHPGSGGKAWIFADEIVIGK